MISEKTSLLIPAQLPEFVRDNPDYANFNLFLKAYYEWMEEQGPIYDTRRLMEYADIDEVSNKYIDNFLSKFLCLYCSFDIALIVWNFAI